MILEKAGGVRAMEELGERTARDPGGGCSLQIENGVALDSPIVQLIYLGTVIVHMSERFGLPCVLFKVALGVLSSQNINMCQVTKRSHICSTEMFTKRFKPDHLRPATKAGHTITSRCCHLACCALEYKKKIESNFPSEKTAGPSPMNFAADFLGLRSSI